MMKIFRKIVSPPALWGVLYFGIIPLFAIIYTVLPDNWFGYNCANNNLSNYLNSLYFSTITITTLGFGDVYPIDSVAKILVIVESLLGILLIGFFLNAIAFRKSKLDAIEEKKKIDEERKRDATFRLCRQYVVLEPFVAQYIDYAAVVSTPIMKRTGGFQYNPDFKFNDLYDLYQPTMRLCDDFNESAISHFYKSLHGFERRLETLISSVDISYWPDLEYKILKMLRLFKEYDYESSILAYTPSRFGNDRLAKAQAQLIENWSDEIKYYPSNAINGPVALYYLIKQSVPLAQQINSQIIEIDKTA